MWALIFFEWKKKQQYSQQKKDHSNWIVYEKVVEKPYYMVKQLQSFNPYSKNNIPMNLIWNFLGLIAELCAQWNFYCHVGLWKHLFFVKQIKSLHGQKNPTHLIEAECVFPSTYELGVFTGEHATIGTIHLLRNVWYVQIIPVSQVDWR